MNDLQRDRDGFKSRWGFTLACVGSAVGMGNIWRFPYMVSEWGRTDLSYSVYSVRSPYRLHGDYRGNRTGAFCAGRTHRRLWKVYGSQIRQKVRSVDRRHTCGGSPLPCHRLYGGRGLDIQIHVYGFQRGAVGSGQRYGRLGGMFGSTAAAWGNNMWLIIAYWRLRQLCIRNRRRHRKGQ